MHYRRLGRTNLHVSVLGLGGGGQSRLGKATGASQDDVARLVDRAIDLGINLFDTAHDYGTEDLLGPALAKQPRDSVVICTKFGPYAKGRVVREANSLRSELEESLRRLHTDYVDVLYLHGVPPPSYVHVVERFLPELRAAQRDGLVRFIGVSESYGLDAAHDLLEEEIPNGLWDVVMVGYNMLSPLAGERVLPLAVEHDVGVTVMCAVRSVISQPDKVARQIANWKAEGLLVADAPPDLSWMLRDGVSSPIEAAYKFAAEPPGVSCVLCGTGNPDHLEANVRAILGPPLPVATSQRLRKLFVPVGRNIGHGARV
jgi:L-galactose dehydrogenase